jgi:diadenosine tetraphosphate (Ap4A) HIT family hydrolase
MTCKLCAIQENREMLSSIKIYEDEICVGVLSKKPASICHVVLFPRKHYTILEQVPDNEIGHMLIVSNKISRAMFESLNIQGTNIFIENGIPAGQTEPHFLINIISRTENDDVKLGWEPKQMSEEQMSTLELQYKQHTDGVVFSAETKKPEIQKEEKKEEIKQKDADGEENYMIKYFNKIP